MPWPKDHKEKTKAKIVSAAAAAFREGGLSAIGVDEVMSRAGLTHGAFYSHFESKDDLVRAALERASEETLEYLSKARESVPPEGALRAATAAYLSPQHAAHPEVGCPLAALGPEVARGGGKPKRELSQGTRRRLAWIRALLPKRHGGTSQDDEEAAIGVTACMIGALIMARTVGGKESEAILESARRFIDRALEER
jgi:TetR/AcrR family transcriptional repressor of nem operon